MKRFVCSLFVFVLLLSPVFAKEPIRIGFITDVHLNFQTNRPVNSFNSNFDKVIQAVNASNVDLVVITGDLTDNGRPEQMDLFKNRISRFKAPVMFIPGNHDIGHSGNPQRDMTTSPERLKTFQRKLGPLYFARENAGVRVVAISSPIIGSGLEQDKAQWKFLEKELSRPASKPTLLLTHYPVFFQKTNEPPAGYWARNPKLRGEFLHLLKQGNVKAVLSGHIHTILELHQDGILHLTGTTIGNRHEKGPGRRGWMLLNLSENGAITHSFQRLQ